MTLSFGSEKKIVNVDYLSVCKYEEVSIIIVFQFASHLIVYLAILLAINTMDGDLK